MIHTLRSATTRNGFTLVELLVVVVLLAIFAAAIVPSLSGRDAEAKAASAHSAVRSIARQLEQHRSSNGDWPAQVEAAWFRGYKLPVNPLQPNHPRTVQDDINPAHGKWHPRDKTTDNFPFWYNPLNGAIRIRVPRQASDEETLALYNAANGADVAFFTGTGK